MSCLCTLEPSLCTQIECRVAAHIIAGIYPLKLSKFLMKAYQPLKENERKELMSAQKMYFTYLMKENGDDEVQKMVLVDQFKIFLDMDTVESTLRAEIASAFAEHYLIDMAIPVQDLLHRCSTFSLNSASFEIDQLKTG